MAERTHRRGRLLHFEGFLWSLFKHDTSLSPVFTLLRSDLYSPDFNDILRFSNFRLGKNQPWLCIIIDDYSCCSNSNQNISLWQEQVLFFLTQAEKCPSVTNRLSWPPVKTLWLQVWPDFWVASPSETLSGHSPDKFCSYYQHQQWRHDGRFASAFNTSAGRRGLPWVAAFWSQRSAFSSRTMPKFWFFHDLFFFCYHTTEPTSFIGTKYIQTCSFKLGTD